jgi:hypothetical protein
LNDTIRKASLLAVQKAAGKKNHRSGMILHESLPVGFVDGTNSLFRSQL